MAGLAGSLRRERSSRHLRAVPEGASRQPAAEQSVTNHWSRLPGLIAARVGPLSGAQAASFRGFTGDGRVGCQPSMDAPGSASRSAGTDGGGWVMVLSSIRPVGAALREPLARMEMRGSGPNRHRRLEAFRLTLGFPDPVSLTVCPYSFLRLCLHVPTAAFRSLFSFPRPLRWRREPGRIPSSSSLPRRSAPSCWPTRPRPASSACVRSRRPATGPMFPRVGWRAGRRRWLR